MDADASEYRSDFKSRYKDDIVALASGDMLSRNPEKLTNAIIDIGQICWIGGENIQTFAIHYRNHDGLYGSSFGPVSIGKKLIEALYSVSLDESIRLAALKTLSILCRGNATNQNEIARQGLLAALFICLQDNSNVIRRWSAHCMYFVLALNPSLQQTARDQLDHKGLKERLASLVAEGGWRTGWQENEAKQVIGLLWPDMELEVLITAAAALPAVAAPGAIPPQLRRGLKSMRQHVSRKRTQSSLPAPTTTTATSNSS
eukprot:TRINITY_DN356_c0_g1_i1.p1 TRINITY_DN356_c0_g1~~TRINITY_DN356_c0_g1_i1.p1  ORF type:complete len:259 (-),score=25.33 TRINITY_DN356_c0_g1_i1:639-1415(-)